MIVDDIYAGNGLTRYYEYSKYPKQEPVEKKCSTCRNASNKCTRICNKCFDNVSQIHENWQYKGETMKYKIIEAISAKTLLDKNPCGGGFADYVGNFGIEELISNNFIDFIAWAEAEGHIGWLINKGFIEKVEDEKKHTITFTQGQVNALFALLTFNPLITSISSGYESSVYGELYRKVNMYCDGGYKKHFNRIENAWDKRA